MERRAHGVLGGKISRIKESNVDPAWLAQRLYSAKIIGKADEERAKKSDVPEAQRCGKLVEMVQRNGRKGVFQRFVSILLSEPHLDWLGEELRGKVYSVAYTLVIGGQDCSLWCQYLCDSFCLTENVCHMYLILVLFIRRVHSSGRSLGRWAIPKD